MDLGKRSHVQAVLGIERSEKSSEAPTLVVLGQFLDRRKREPPHQLP